MSRVVGAYVCPRGVFAVECRHRGDGLEILRSFDAFAGIGSLQEGASHLSRLLGEAGIKHAQVAVAVRGFGLVHHILAAPPGGDDMDAAVLRDLQQLDPDLADPAPSWIRLGTESESDETPVLAAGIDRMAVEAFSQQLASNGHKLGHFTALPAAMHRLSEEFLAETHSAAMVSMLPDGPFLSYSLNGVMLLVVEPAVAQFEAVPTAAEVAEEAESGAVFFRQQFGGAHIAGATLVAADESYDDLAAAMGTRLPVPVRRLAIQELGVGGIVALGAVLDANSASPLRLGGTKVGAAGDASTGRRIAIAVAVATSAVAVLWAVAKVLSARGP